MCRDYQEIKIQENVQLLGVGSIPRSMPVILMDDLVDSIKPGCKQHLCALSTRLCGTTNTNLLPHMSSVVILHSFFLKHFEIPSCILSLKKSNP